jgi:hypothetical protein
MDRGRFLVGCSARQVQRQILMVSLTGLCSRPARLTTAPAPNPAATMEIYRAAGYSQSRTGAIWLQQQRCQFPARRAWPARPCALTARPIQVNGA